MPRTCLFQVRRSSLPSHRSLLDIPIIGAATDRRIRTLAKIDLFSPRPLGWFMAALCGYPVRRGTADREALRLSIMFLGRGEMMMVYPEGTRRSGPEVTDIFDGCAYLAAKTGALVVPVGIAGTEGAMPKKQEHPPAHQGGDPRRRTHGTTHERRRTDDQGRPRPVLRAVACGAPEALHRGPCSRPATRRESLDVQESSRSSARSCRVSAPPSSPR